MRALAPTKRLHGRRRRDGATEASPGRVSRTVALFRFAARPIVFGLLLGICSCENGNNPTTQPTPPSTNGGPAGTATAEPVEMFVENDRWSREEAVAKLDDEAEAVRAAVRLVRLADASPLIVPAPLPVPLAERLKVVRLSQYGVWAFGCADAKNERMLRCPVLIDGRENVTLPAEGVDEEILILHVSDRPDSFPHLLMLPGYVWFVTNEDDSAVLANALVRVSPPTVQFELAERDGYAYVRLALRGESESKQVAEYRWDPYELSFMGPAIDKLPHPPGGKFELDIRMSTGLIPMGGEIPDPEPIEPPPDKKQGEFKEWAFGGVSGEDGERA